MAKHGDTKQRAAMAEREHRRNKRILRLLCFVVAIAVAFVAGFALRSSGSPSPAFRKLAPSRRM